jgi:hypothetical protein
MNVVDKRNRALHDVMHPGVSRDVTKGAVASLLLLAGHESIIHTSYTYRVTAQFCLPTCILQSSFLCSKIRLYYFLNQPHITHVIAFEFYLALKKD